MTIGFVGAVTDELPSLVSPAGIADITVGDPAEAVNRVADQLSDGNEAERRGRHRRPARARGCGDDRHRVGDRPGLALRQDRARRRTTNVDAIVSGHTHLAYNHVIDGRPVISSGQYGEQFSRMDIQCDKSTKSVTMNERDLQTSMDGTDAALPGRPRGRSRSSPRPWPSPTCSATSKLGDTTADFGRAVFGDPAGATVVPREPRRRVDARQLRRRRAAVVAQRGRRRATWTIAFMNPGGLRADLASGRGHLPRGRERAAVREHAGDAEPHGCAGQAGARAAVAARRRVASVPQARREQGAHVHLRPRAPRRDRTSPRCC